MSGHSRLAADALVVETLEHASRSSPARPGACVTLAARPARLVAEAAVA